VPGFTARVSRGDHTDSITLAACRRQRSTVEPDDPRLDDRPPGLFRSDDTRQGQFLEHDHRRIVGG